MTRREFRAASVCGAGGVCVVDCGCDVVAVTDTETMRTGDEFQGPTCPRCDELCYPDETRCPMCGSLLLAGEVMRSADPSGSGLRVNAVRAPDLPTPPQAVRLPAACVTTESIQGRP